MISIQIPSHPQSIIIIKLSIMFRHILLFLLVALSLSLYTRAMIEKVRENNLLRNSSIHSVPVSTICNRVDLSGDNYSGIVRSGYLTVGKGNSALAFTFYGRSDETDETKLNNYPTIIWLNGGPGSSSQFGNFNELGPLWVVRQQGGSSLITQRNKFSWANDYNLLFVDQPVGTGLSYADPEFKGAYVTSMDGKHHVI